MYRIVLGVFLMSSVAVLEAQTARPASPDVRQPAALSLDQLFNLESRVLRVQQGGMTIADSPKTAVVVAVRHADGSIEHACVENAEQARRFFRRSSQQSALAEEK